MGLISFIKEAGEKIFGSKASAEEQNAEKQKQIVDFVEQFKLEIEDLSVTVDGDTATLKGTAASQADREKLVLAVGNINGIATVDDQMEVKEPKPEAQYYTVVRGDSLSKIAKEYYGDAMKYPVIFEANKPMLKDPNLIYPGQMLRIPPLDSDE